MPRFISSEWVLSSGAQMKAVKYLGSIVCAILAIGTLIFPYLFLKGTIEGTVENWNHFFVKSLIYCAEALILAFVAVKLFRAARHKPNK